MGLSRLFLVAPKVVDIETVFRFAVHAKDIMANAVCCDTLSEAVEDCARSVVVFTEPPGPVNSGSPTLPDLVRQICMAEIEETAFVFADRPEGFLKKELLCCSYQTYLGTEDRPVLLSHGVQAVSYEVYRTLHEASGAKFFSQAGQQDLNNISASLKPALPQRDTQFLLDLFRRATLSKTEARRLAAMLASIGGMINRGKWS